MAALSSMDRRKKNIYIERERERERKRERNNHYSNNDTIATRA